MQYFIVGISLPREGYFAAIRKHTSQARLVWTEKDRESYFTFRTHLEQLYNQPSAGALNFRRSDYHALYNEQLDAQTALNRVLPFFVTGYADSHDAIQLPSWTHNSAEILAPCGRTDVAFGVRHVVIGKGVGRLEFQPWVLQAVSERRGSDFTAEEAATLEGRSDPHLIDVVAFADKPVATEGVARIVALPAETNVRLSRNHRGEFVSEIPRIWS